MTSAAGESMGRGRSTGSHEIARACGRSRTRGERSEFPGKKGGGEHGAGTVLVLGVILATVMALLGLMALGDAVATKERTQDVADVAALAGAQKLRYADESAACQQANDVVARHGLMLASCAVEARHVLVTVGTRTHMVDLSVESSARAGPADEPPPWI